jgi:group II intron reverse transcriptase/maturase
MATGREKWDRCIVPESLRKEVLTASRKRGGKAATVNQSAGQLELALDIADSPQGDVSMLEMDLSKSSVRAVPKSGDEQQPLPPMTLESVASIDNLREAFRQVRANKGAPGPDRQTVEEVEVNLSTILPVVQKALLDGSYRPGMIRRVWIPKPGGGRRGLGIPNVVTRMVAQAAHQVMSPHFEPTFHDSSHGFRPGRSCHTAIAEAQTYVAEGRNWMVDLDLSQFFDRVNHDRLLERLRQRIQDPRLLRLIWLMLKAKVVLPNGVVVSTDEGTPQGGPLSPLLSNIVLDELDGELARRGHRFVRYADDVNIYVHSERSGRRVMASITRFIEKRLRLQVNQDKSAVAHPDERHFLGFRLCWSEETGVVDVHLSERSRRRIDDRIDDLTPRYWGRELRDCIQKLNQYLKGWLGFFSICTEAGALEFQRLDAHIRRRLRAILLAQWKTKRTIVKRLLALGVHPRSAWKVYRGRKRLWALSHLSPVDRGLRNAWFADRGLVSLWDRWRRTDHPRHLGLGRPQIAPEYVEAVIPLALA